eukprot:TRINITY_DN8840_c0_g1_i1.p1 TRINITY_DN8840_c0_g1~~TRINITY_DN8840_c0_g1_i1.p1  ORF type:complete len:220 (+),score=12.46 TRINITY_DN8840_c0_g1_i1:62-721(+)
MLRFTSNSLREFVLSQVMAFQQCFKSSTNHLTMFQKILPTTYLSKFDIQARCFSKEDKVSKSAEDKEQQWTVVYEGPFRHALKNLKLVSITSTSVAFLGSPLIVMFAAGTTPIKIITASSFCIFGAFTTGLLHWFTSPYVHQLKLNKESLEMSASTVSLFGGKVHTKFGLNEIEPPRDTYKPLATFRVGNKIMYVDQEYVKDRRIAALLQQPRDTNVDI